MIGIIPYGFVWLVFNNFEVPELRNLCDYKLLFTKPQGLITSICLNVCFVVLFSPFSIFITEIYLKIYNTMQKMERGNIVRLIRAIKMLYITFLKHKHTVT